MFNALFLQDVIQQTRMELSSRMLSEDSMLWRQSWHLRYSSGVMTLVMIWLQVLEDISELRKQWVQGRVDRVSHNTFKLYQVRKNLKTSKVINQFS